MSFKANVFLFIFCLDDLCVDESGILKSPTIIEWPSVSPFVSVNICFIYLGAHFLKRFSLFIFRERSREGGREGETSM